MPRFAAIYLPFFTAKSVCIGVYPWLKTGSVAAPLLRGLRVLGGFFCFLRSFRKKRLNEFVSARPQDLHVVNAGDLPVADPLRKKRRELAAHFDGQGVGGVPVENGHRGRLRRAVQLGQIPAIVHPAGIEPRRRGAFSRNAFILDDL